MTKRADYGLDAPGVVRTMGSIALALAMIVVLLPVGPGLKSAGTWMSASFLLSAIAMIASSRIGKMKARDSLLDSVPQFTRFNACKCERGRSERPR